MDFLLIRAPVRVSPLSWVALTRSAELRFGSSVRVSPLSWIALTLARLLSVGLLCAPSLSARDIALAWEPSPDPDVAGYFVYVGSASRSYDRFFDAGHVTNTTVLNLNECPVYYFVVTAYDAAGRESDPSNEARSAWLRLHCAPDSTVEAPAAPVFPSPVASDAAGAVRLAYEDATLPGNCDSGGRVRHAIRRTWTATDECGRTATAGQTIAVQDTTPPSLVCAPDAAVEFPAVPVFPNPAASDAAGTVALAFEDTTLPGNCDDGGCVRYAIRRTWTATDECGHTATASQTIAVREVAPPSPPVILVQPRSRQVSAGSDVVLNVEAMSRTLMWRQWQRDEIDLPGATNAALTLINVELEDASHGFQVYGLQKFGKSLKHVFWRSKITDFWK